MVPWQRNVNARSSFAWDARCVTSFAKGTMRRSARWRNNVTEVTVVTTNGLISTVAATSSGRIVAIAIVVTPMTNATRSGMTRLPLITATRHSSHAQCMGLRTSTPLRSATRTQGTTNVNFKTRSALMKRIITMHATQATMMNCTLARIHRSQVRIRHQLQARARRITKMRTIIFMFQKNWRQVAMCLASLTINDRGASSSWVKKVKKEKHLLLFWTMVSILWTPS